MNRIAILGGFGQLGSEIAACLGDRGVPLSHADADITDPAHVAPSLEAVRPEAVINCAAYNLVDKAEEHSHAAFALNATGAGNVARWCAEHHVPMLHVSTDYVFGRDFDRRTPYAEEDVCGPVNVYGESKLLGESIVCELCPQSWIVRTCGLYGRKSTRAKGNFVETMLRLGGERPELRIVSDQRCTPTSAADLAEAIVRLIETDAYGLYHATNSGDCSWYDFAAEIFRLSGLSPRLVPVTSAQFGMKAPRPAYSVLDGSKLATTTGHALRPWREALRDYLSERGS